MRIVRTERGRRAGRPRARAAGRRAPRARLLVSATASLVALSACGAPPEIGPEEQLCARLVRFHVGLNHPVEITATERVPDKPNVRIAYRGTRRESSTEGTALCRLSDQTGELLVLGGQVDGERLEDNAVQAFNRFVESRHRLGP